MMQAIKEYAVAMGLGAVIYSLVEILFRGYTHWTMTVTGGITFAVLYIIYANLSVSNPILRCLLGCVLGCLVITGMEFAVGCVVNRWLGWGVWDYSHRSFNILGQICPLFSLGWFGLSLPAYWLCIFLHGQWVK